LCGNITNTISITFIKDSLMQKRQIGKLDVSVVGLGCNNFGRRIDADGTVTVVNAALDAGINFFDTADVYGAGQSEEFLGRALGQRRSEVLIATKFGNNMEGQGSGAQPEYIHKAAEASLRRLNTDYIDLYQIHKPDPTVPIADTLGALNELVQAGKVREIGCSNFSAEQLREVKAVLPANAPRFESVQNYYSLLHREPEADVLPECDQQGLTFLPYFPLESGLLTGKYRQGQPVPEGTRLTNTDRVTDAILVVVERLVAYAEARGHTILELAVSWLLARSAVVSVIAGATNAQQVQANVAAANWQLTATELAEIDALLK
jgi:aryl-alcohol dehydrogenase-like predicted oxidoreductase